MAISVADSSSAKASTLYADKNLRVLGAAQLRLASGSRIADPSEDAGSAAIGAKFTSDISTLTQVSRNASTGQNVAQFMIGALSSTLDILTRMQTLAAQSNSSSVSSTEQSMLNLEFQQLMSQISSIQTNTKWLSTALMTASTGNMSFQVGLGSAVTVGFNTIDLTSGGTVLSFTTTSMANVSATASAADTYEAVSSAINNVANQIATVGAIKSRFKYISDSLALEIQNKSAAKSTFVDADVMTDLTTLQATQGLFDMATSMFKQSISKLKDIAGIVQEVAR